MTKKWTALLLAAVLAVGLSACDTSRAEAPSSNLEKRSFRHRGCYDETK